MNNNLKLLKVPVEVYSRVVGYYRPVNQWNRGKQEEFHERQYLKPDFEIMIANNKRFF